ncbi:MAG: molybdopterin molybdotransferase MoeA [Methanotrichaceae archaeon]
MKKVHDNMFKQLASASEASRIVLGRCRSVTRRETLPLAEASNRVLSQDLNSPVNLPGFDRAAMDGYAVKAEDTRGASQLAPVYLEIGDRSGNGKCVPVKTGMPVSGDADAVVMVEDAVSRGNQVEITAEVHTYRNLARAGEDVAQEDIVFSDGHKLRPPDIALLAALGLVEVEVYQRPKVAIVPTGSELVPFSSGKKLDPGQAYETNGLMSELYVKIWGGIPRREMIVEDDPQIIRETVLSNLDADLILLSGGTSVGERDYAPLVLEDLGDLLVHGVRITPGRPTALGMVEKTPIICLPGYPVAALAALYLFAKPLIKKLAHLEDLPIQVKAKLTRKIVSRPGYLTFARIKLDDDKATPIMTTGAGILSSVAQAQGYVLVPEELEGIEPGDTVTVNLIE